MAIGEGLMIVGGTILAFYPILIAILLDILIFLAIFKFAEDSKPPFLTGFLLGSMFSNRQSHTSSPESSYIALAILAPINAGLAVLLCLYLGINLPLALMVCFGPLAVAFAFIAIGAVIKHISFKEELVHFSRAVDRAANSLWTYLSQQKPAVGIGLLLGVSLVVGVALLFHFGLPFYAYAVGFATVGALLLLGLGYIAKFAFDAINQTKGGAGEHPEAVPQASYEPSGGLRPGGEQPYSKLVKQPGADSRAPSEGPRLDS